MGPSKDLNSPQLPQELAQIFSSGTENLVRYRNSRQAQKIDGERFRDSAIKIEETKERIPALI